MISKRRGGLPRKHYQGRFGPATDRERLQKEFAEKERYRRHLEWRKSKGLPVDPKRTI